MQILQGFFGYSQPHTVQFYNTMCTVFVKNHVTPWPCNFSKMLVPLKYLNFQINFFIMDHSVCTIGQLGYIKDVGAEYKWDNLRQAPMMSSTMPTPRLST